MSSKFLALIITIGLISAVNAQQGRPQPRQQAQQPAPVARATTTPQGQPVVPVAQPPAAVAADPAVKEILEQPVEAQKAEDVVHPIAAATEEKIDNPCFMVLCSTDPKQCLMFDGDGNWMRSARSTEVTFEFPANPTVKYLAWDGPFKPTTPREEFRTLKGIKTVSAEEFQNLVDDLNGGQAVQFKD